MLSKYNLDSAGNWQDTTGNNNTCVFATTNYWNKADENLNTYGIPEETTSIITTAKSYGTALGVNGRLMTAYEVLALGADTSSYATDSCPDFINSQNYWLGTSNTYRRVWAVNGSEKQAKTPAYNDEDASIKGTFGIRPVLEVPTSEIEV